MILFLVSKILSILEFCKNWGYTLILKNKGFKTMDYRYFLQLIKKYPEILKLTSREFKIWLEVFNANKNNQC